MNIELSEINQVYKDIQDYVDPESAYLLRLAQDHEEWQAHQIKAQELQDTYKVERQKLRELLPKLTPKEISVGYKRGCRLLQRNLSGYMGDNFSVEYIPTMHEAVEDNHYHTAWLFLEALSYRTPNDMEKIVAIALDKEPLQEVALRVIRRLKLTRFLNETRSLTKSTNEDIRLEAIDTLSIISD